MRIREIIITPYVIDKLIWKHHVSEAEVRQVLRNRPKIRFWEKGRLEGENLYLALGQTDAGRYLAVYFIYKRNQNALIVTARNMDAKERRRYAKK